MQLQDFLLSQINVKIPFQPYRPPVQRSDWSSDRAILYVFSYFSDRDSQSLADFFFWTQINEHSNK